MKTLRPDLTTDRNKSTLSLLDVNIGSILKDVHLATSKNICFIVAGISLSDYLMIPLINAADAATLPVECTVIIKHSTHLLATGTAYYADCSKVIVRRFGAVGQWLKKHRDGIDGALDERDMLAVNDALITSATISRHIKKEFSLNN